MHRSTFWLVWIVGVGPMLLATFLYFGLGGPAEGTQRGVLLPPGKTVENWQLLNAEGKGVAANGRWQLLLTSPEQCENRCAWWHQQLGQVHKALGKEQGRVQWLALAGQPGMERIGEGVWVVDPNGNLVLRYNLAQPPEDLLKDLRRLLKVSRIG